MWLEKFALPNFDNKIIEEINFCNTCYNEIIKVNETNFNKIQKKKEIISLAFEILIGLFDLGYDLKIKYGVRDIGDDCVIVENLNESFDVIFYQIYLQCFKRYLDRIYKFNNIRIDDSTFTLSRLAILNDEDELVKILADNVYIELLNNKIELEHSLIAKTITKKNIKELLINEDKRISNLTKEIDSIDTRSKLTPFLIREVFSCFSSHIFEKLDNKQKAHICELLCNYFDSDSKVYKKRKYLKLVENKSNADCLKMIIKDLLIEGRTMIVKRKNMDIVNNVLSGLSVIYSNEIKKEKVGELDNLKEIIMEIKR